jgi:N4-gp56 family major capsid protein
MAATDFGALSDARKRLWSAEVWQAGRDQSFWFANGFMGRDDRDMNRPIHRITKLTETERGLECVMQLVADLEGDGVAGDNKLEDNEEQLVNDTQVIRVDQLRNGVRSKGEMAEQATVIRFRVQSREKLAFWLSDKMDEMLFLVASGRALTLKTDGSTRVGSQLPQLTFAGDIVAASANRLKHAGTATSEATITASDTMSWNEIVELKAFAKRQKIKPIRDRGKDFYVIVMSTEQARDVMLDNTYQTIVSRAGERGSQNPLFRNAMAVVQGCVLHEHNKVFNTLGLTSGNKFGAGGTIDGAQSLLLGSQAVGFATIGNAQMRESDNTDYGNRPGIGFGRKIGMLKPQYKVTASGVKEDFGVISFKTAAAA